MITNKVIRKMKKIFISTLVLATCMTLTSCGLGTTGTSNNTESNLLQNNAFGSTSGSLLGNVMSQLFSGATTNAESIVGTWNYSTPKVVFESENILAQLGSSVVSNKIESQFDAQLKKYGFNAGVTKFTFNKDNTCSFTVGSKTIPGTYTFDASSRKMTVTGALGVGTITCTTSITGNQMYMLFDADKVLAIAGNLSSASPKTSTLSSILQNYSGLKLGWVLTK